jgi:diacylglycerol kinase (ATP)
MNPPPWLVLVNPAAGRRPLPVERVRRALQTVEVAAEVVTIYGSDEMHEALVGATRSGRERVAVVGGDGTVNLAVNALLSVPGDQRPLLGMLPHGSGCDLLRTFAIPQSLEAAARHLAGDQRYTIDVGVLEGEWGRRLFVNVAQAGVGAAAAQSAPRLPRRLGSPRYPAAFAARLPGFPAADVTLEGRRSYQGRALAVILANGQYFAGGWNIAPKAALMDGLLDVQVIDVPKTAAPRLVPKLIRGLHLTERGVRRLTLDKVRLETDVPWPVEADGDYLGNTPLVASVLPAAVDLKI